MFVKFSVFIYIRSRVRSVPVQQKKSVSYRFLRNYSKIGNRYMNTVFLLQIFNKIMKFQGKSLAI